MKKCLECGDTLIGRSDKKFCSDACRNTFNNKSNSENNLFIRNVNNALKKNRKILEELLVGDKTKVHKDVLYKRSFDFDLITRIYTTQKGSVYRFCYEYGYLQLEHDFVLIVKREQTQ